VAKWLKWIPDRCKRRFYRQKRLLNQLKSKHTTVRLTFGRER
jgi:hypothetical protein